MIEAEKGENNIDTREESRVKSLIRGYDVQDSGNEVRLCLARFQ